VETYGDAGHDESREAGEESRDSEQDMEAVESRRTRDLWALVHQTSRRVYPLRIVCCVCPRFSRTISELYLTIHHIALL